jgi:salicylate hydroxylase
MTFQIIICGAGIAGLVTGIGLAKQNHRVLILDEAHALSPIGVGLHIPPNSTRVLQKMDLASRLQPFAQSPEGIIMRRYADNSIITQAPLPRGDPP